VTRAEFVSGLTRLGAVETLSIPGGNVLAILDPQPVPGTGRKSRVAFLLPEQVTGRPQAYVDADLRTRSGGSPNNWTTTVFGTQVLGTWSFNSPWNPAQDSADALALAVLAQWNR